MGTSHILIVNEKVSDGLDLRHRLEGMGFEVSGLATSCSAALDALAKPARFGIHTHLDTEICEAVLEECRNRVIVSSDFPAGNHSAFCAHHQLVGKPYTFDEAALRFTDKAAPP